MLPSYSHVKAINEPSGEKMRPISVPGELVRRSAFPPERGTLHRSPAYENTICVRFIAGVRNRSPDSAKAAGTIASQSAVAIETRFITGGDPQMNHSISNT